MLAQDYFKVGKRFYYVSSYVNKNFDGMKVDMREKADLKVETLKENINEEKLIDKYKPEITLEEVVSFIENSYERGFYLFLLRNKNSELVWLYANRYGDGGLDAYVFQLDDTRRSWHAGDRLVLRNKPFSLCPHCEKIIKLSN